MFIRHALVYGEWSTHHRFYRENLRLLEEAEELEHRARRRDLVVDEHTLFDFYDARIGPEVVSGAHFDSWWKQVRRRDPDLLTFDPAMLTHDTAEEVHEADYPQAWEAEGLTFPISYVFQPGAPDDGLTIDVPVATLNRVEADDFSWNVPGLREELVTSLLRSLPKNLRVSFVPAPNTARSSWPRCRPGDEPLLDALERYLRSTTGVRRTRATPGTGRRCPPPPADLPRRRRRAAPSRRAARISRPSRHRCSRRSTRRWPRSPPTSACPRPARRTWTFGTIEESIVQRRAGHEVRGFPALVDEGIAVGLGVFGSDDEADARHRLGVRRLLLLGMRRVDPLAGLDNAAKLGLAGSPYPNVAELVDDLRAAVPARSSTPTAGPRRGSRSPRCARSSTPSPTSASRPRRRRAAGARRLAPDREADQRASRAAHAGRDAGHARPGRAARGRGFVGRGRARPAAPLPDVPRRGRPPPRAARRQVARDAQLMAQIADLQEAYLHQVDALPEGRPPGAALRRVRWMLEEYRVSLWAQHLGTAYSVSRPAHPQGAHEAASPRS